ncbi:unnamed protein product [Closterium sp. NIES-54]
MGPMLVEILVTGVMEVLVVEVVIEVVEVDVIEVVFPHVRLVCSEPQGAASSGGSAGASPGLSPQQLREWFVRHARLCAGATAAGGAGVIAGAGARGGTAVIGPRGARTQGTGAAGTGGVEGAGVGDPTESGATGADGSGAGGVGAGGAGVGGTGARGTGVGDPGVGGAGAGGASAVDPGGAVRPRPYFFPLLQQQSGGLTERCEPASRLVSPVCTARPVPHTHPPNVPGTHAMTLCPSYVPLRVPLPAPPESSLPEVHDPESDRARAANPTFSRLLATGVTDPSFESAAASALVAELLDFGAACCLEGDPDAPDIPTPPSSAEAITGTYVDEVPPPGANIVDGMWIFRVKRPSGSPPAFNARGFSQRQGVDYFQTFSPTSKMTTLRVLLHVAAQRDYKLHSLDFNTAFLQGNVHEVIWLRCPPGFTESFRAGTQWSLRRLVYGLHQAPCEWHDTLRTTLAALGFALATADPSLFLPTDTSLLLFYVLVYLGLQITRDRARRIIILTQSHMVHQVRQRFGFQFSSPQPTPLSTSHSLSAPPSDESVEPSGLYPELVGYLITSGMGLVLGGRGPIVLTGHADASWHLPFPPGRTSSNSPSQRTFALPHNALPLPSLPLPSDPFFLPPGAVFPFPSRHTSPLPITAHLPTPSRQTYALRHFALVEAAPTSSVLRTSTAAAEA